MQLRGLYIENEYVIKHGPTYGGQVTNQRKSEEEEEEEDEDEDEDEDKKTMSNQKRN